MVDQRVFQLALANLVGQAEEIEGVRVLEQLLGQIGLGRRQGLLEVRNGPALAAVKVRFDLMNQHGAGPAMFRGFAGVPDPFHGILQLFDQNGVVPPRNFGDGFWQMHSVQFSHRLWENWGRQVSHRLWEIRKFFRIAKIERPHPPDVCRGEPLDPGKRGLDVSRQSFNNALAPAFSLLPLDDQMPNLPVQLDQFPIHREGGADLRLADSMLDRLEQLRIAGRQIRSRYRWNGAISRCQLFLACHVFRSSISAV